MMLLSYAATKKAIEQLQVSPQDNEDEDAPLVPFRLYPEQQRLLKVICDNSNVIVCKSRQIGSTTLCLAYAVLFAASTPGVDVAVCAHNAKTIRNIFTNLKKFASQLGLRLLKDTAVEIELANNSRITANTAGAATTGRSYSYSLIICSEAAYYQDSAAFMASMLGAKKSKCQIILESTASAQDTHYRRAWESKKWTKFFSGFEAHHNYKADPNKITDQQWEDLQEQYGFTDRSAAAWWWDKYEESGRDEYLMLKEFPLFAEQAFTVADSRFIPVDPELREYERHPDLPKLKIFTPPFKEGRYVLSVDTAAGNGGDDSVVLVWDCLSQQIAAIWTDNHTKPDVFLDVIDFVSKFYFARKIIIETNGIGQPVYDYALRRDLPALEYKAKADTHRSAYWLWARRMITEKGVAADEVFRQNCQSCTAVARGKVIAYEGRKDCIAALSFLGANQDLLERIRSEPDQRQVPEAAFDAKSHWQRYKNSKNLNKNGTHRRI